jgi:hypothetical protein
LNKWSERTTYGPYFTINLRRVTPEERGDEHDVDPDTAVSEMGATYGYRSELYHTHCDEPEDSARRE